MATVNLGSPARGDAGKTALTGRLLCADGLIGSVAPLRLSGLNSKPFDTSGHDDGVAAAVRLMPTPGGVAAIGAGVR